MKVLILFYNVQRLNDLNATIVTTNYIRLCDLVIDLLLIQEHKLKGDLVLKFQYKLWSKVLNWIKEISLRYNNDSF
jgi:hypothetical protein